jgi:hypothetical protein
MLFERLVTGEKKDRSIAETKASDYNEKINKHFNPLTPNGHYSGRTAQLTSRRCILNIYSTNGRTEYFKHAA